MGDEQMGLKVTISGDAEGAVSSGSQIIDVLNRIWENTEKMAASGTSAGAAMAEGHGVAAKAAVEHEAAESLLGATIGKVETATNSAARAFSAMGIQTGEASERVLALTEALDAVGTAATPLIALGTAVLTLGAAFNFVKDAVDDAAKMQTEMTALGIAVKNQGDDWGSAREGVEKWAEALEQATIFSKSEAIAALDQLVTAGVHVADAQKIVTIATDVAAGSHRSLTEVVNALKEAEAGRGMALVQLDEHLKSVVQSHGHLSDALAIFSRDFLGQAVEATDTYDEKQRVLHNTLEALSVEIGTELLPTLTSLTEIFLGVAKEAEKNGKAIGDWGSNVVSAVASVIGAVHDLSTVASFQWNPIAILTESPQDQIKDARTKQEAWNRLLPHPDNSGLNENPLSLFGVGASPTMQQNGMGDFFNKIIEDARESGKKAREEWEKGYRAQALSGLINDPILGNQRGSGSSGTVVEGSEQADKTRATDPVVAAQDHLKQQLAELTTQEGAYKLAVDLSSTSDEHHAAEMAYKAKVVDDAIQATQLLDQQLFAENNEVTKLTAAHKEQNTALANAKSALDSYVRSLPTNEEGEHVAITKEQRAQYDELKKSLSNAQTEYNATAATLKTLNTQIEENNRLIKEHSQHVADDSAAQSEEDRKASDARKKEDERRALQTQQMRDEQETYTMSLQQQINYYSQRYEIEVAANGQYSAEAKKLWDEVYKLEGETFKQLADAHKQLMSEITKEETTLLDNVLSKHKSFRDELKAIWSDIEKDITQSIEKTLTETALKNFNTDLANALSPSGGGGAASSGLLSIFSSVSGKSDKPDGSSGNPLYIKFADGHASAGGSAADHSANASQYGIIGASLGSVGASQILSSLPTDRGVTGVLIGDASASATYQDALGNSYSAKTAQAGKSVIGTAVSDLATGATVSSAIDPGQNSTDSSIGDLLGTGVALLTKANPLAGAALAIGGSLLGGLLGPHETAAQTPDTSEAGYQQWLANWQGTTQTSNGTPTFASAQYDTTIGNQSLATEIANYMNNPTELANAPAGVLAAIKQILPLEGTTGSLALNPNDPEYQGNFNFASGQQMSVSTFQSLINTIQEGAAESGGLTPVYNLARTYPTFTSSLSGQVGTVNDQTGAYTPSAAAAPTSSGSMRTLSSAGGVTVNIDLSNTTLVGSVPDDVMTQIATKLQDLRAGYIAGAPTTSLALQRVGN